MSEGSIEVPVSLQPDVFYGVDGGFLLPLVRLSPSTLPLTPLPPARSDLTHHLEMYESIDAAGEPTAFFLRSTIQVTNLGSGLLIAYPSWLSNPSPLREGEVVLALKNSYLCVYSALNKVTLVTTQVVNDSLHEFLTML